MSRTKECVRKIAYRVFSLINLVLPKGDKILVYGGEYLADNSEAMLRFLSDEHDVNIVCIADKKIDNRKYYQNVKFVKNSSINAFRLCVTSKIVLDSSLHTIKMKPCHGQSFIQMWHGSPLKHLPKDPYLNTGNYYSYIFYASELFKTEMRDSFEAEEKKMFLAGGPRNDYLFDCGRLPVVYQSEGKKVMWLPTFRRGIGLNESSKDIPIITKDSIYSLEEFLNKRKMRLFIKAHPLQENGLRELYTSNTSDTIVLLSDDDLRKNEITLYEMLGNMDALITDYSSVYFDYLLLNRPIGFAVDDFDEYNINRGFAFDNPIDYMPGPKMRSLQDLFVFLDGLNEGKDEYAAEREKVNYEANSFRDNNNRRRCAELIVRELHK